MIDLERYLVVFPAISDGVSRDVGRGLHVVSPVALSVGDNDVNGDAVANAVFDSAEEGWGGESEDANDPFGWCGIRIVGADVSMPEYDELELSQVLA